MSPIAAGAPASNKAAFTAALLAFMNAKYGVVAPLGAMAHAQGSEARVEVTFSYDKRTTIAR